MSNDSLVPKFLELVEIRRGHKICKFTCPYCGSAFVARLSDVKRGQTRSCGCLCGWKELHGRKSKFKYPKTHPLNIVLLDILRRCGYKRCWSEEKLRLYRDRGIDVFGEWVTNRDAFIDFCLNNGWDKSKQVDRKDNNRGYYPDNLRFVSAKENMRNRRCTVRLVDGMPLAEYAESIGIKPMENGRTSKEYRRLRRKLEREHLIKHNDNP